MYVLYGRATLLHMAMRVRPLYIEGRQGYEYVCIGKPIAETFHVHTSHIDYLRHVPCLGM